MFKMCTKAICVAVLVLLGGCAAVQPEGSANHIMVTPNPPSKKCKFVAQVTGNQGNFFTGAWTSNSNLEEGAMNDLRNKAGNLGANYVQLVTTRAGNTGSFSSDFGGSMQQTNVTNLGNAYLCPKSVL